MARPKRGTKAGEEASRKYRETMARKYGEDGIHKFFANIGSKGGRAGSTGGFAADPTKAMLAGAIGGLRSKRMPSENFIIATQDCGDTTRYELEEIISKCTRSMFVVNKTGKSAKIKVRTTEKIVERIVKRLSYLDIKATYEKESLMAKVTEEWGETVSEMNHNRFGAELEDGIGDTLVSLIIYAHICGKDVKKCLENALNEIENRKGTTVDGNFVKEVNNAS